MLIQYLSESLKSMRICSFLIFFWLSNRALLWIVPSSGLRAYGRSFPWDLRFIYLFILLVPWHGLLIFACCQVHWGEKPTTLLDLILVFWIRWCSLYVFFPVFIFIFPFLWLALLDPASLSIVFIRVFFRCATIVFSAWVAILWRIRCWYSFLGVALLIWSIIFP